MKLEKFKNRLNNLYGFLNEDNKLVISCIFEDVTEFELGMASVKINGKWGCINEAGNFVIKPIYKNQIVFSEQGLASVEYADNITSKKFTIDLNGHRENEEMDFKRIKDKSIRIARIIDAFTNGKFKYEDLPIDFFEDDELLGKVNLQVNHENSLALQVRGADRTKIAEKMERESNHYREMMNLVKSQQLQQLSQIEK